MRPIKPNTRSRSMLRTAILTLTAIVIGGAGTVALLGATNVIDLGKLAFWRAKEKPIPPGRIGIPLTSRPIPAYTLVTREYLVNAKTGELEVKWVPKEEANHEATRDGLVFDFNKIIGRVTSREIPAIHNFHEIDFEPVGTRPGESAGVPRGMRAYTFNASGLDGCVYQLKQGDHVDMLVSVPVDMPGSGHSEPSGASIVATPDTLIQPKRTLEIPLVQDGVVISPVTARVSQVTNSSVMNGASTRNVRIEEIVIAVWPKEVAPLDEAKALKHRLTCVARSGLPEPVAAPVVPRPSGVTAPGGMPAVVTASVKSLLGKDRAAAPDKASPPADGAFPAMGNPLKPTTAESPAKDPAAMDITPGLNPMADVRYMEVMIGGKRQFVLFNGPGNSPVVAAEIDGSANSDAAIAPAQTPAAAPAAAPAAPAEENQE